MQPTTTEVTIPTDDTGDWGLAILGSPWLWGTAITFGFYALVPYLPVEREFVTRYFCGHWIEYATAGLFFFGMTILARKALSLTTEAGILRTNTFGKIQFSDDSGAVDRAQLLWNATSQLPRRLRQTKLMTRIRQVCQYILGRKSRSGLEDHMKYLADLGAEELHSSYAFIRTITWAIPILGFLGTVIGITMAIANVTPEQLESSLGEVTAGLAVAFDTTALSLALSMVMVFSTFIVDRYEQSILTRVEKFGISRLAPCFPPEADSQSPWANAEAQAADQLLHRTEAVITLQTDMWQGALENLRSRWLETADLQQSQFASALQQGMETNLSSHAQQLNDVRSEFLTGFRSVASEMSRLVDSLQEAAQSQQQSFAQQVTSTWQQVETAINRLRDDQQEQSTRSLELMTATSEQWRQDLQQATSAMAGQLQELEKQGELLRQISGHEQTLAELQSTLQQNLQSIRTLETFEQAIHSLNAAVHLLTARARAHAA